MIRSLSLGALALLALPSLGCDVCGMFMSLQPNDRTSTLGLTWRMRYREGTYTTTGFGLAKHGGAVETVNSLYREIYQVADLRADIWFGQRFAVLASLPVVNNYQSVDGLTSADVYGVGDALFIGRYLVANTTCGPNEHKARHRFMLGAGAKLPTGATDRTFVGETVGPDLQPGSGSVDVLGSLEYLFRKGKWGASLNAIGRFNGEHAGYRFGHGLNLTTEAFRIIEAGTFRIMPSAGGYLELAAEDEQNGERISGTGGPTLFSHVAARGWWGSWSLGITWQHAVIDEQGAMMVPNRERVIIGITRNI